MDELSYGHTRIAVGKKKVEWVGVTSDPKRQGGIFRIGPDKQGEVELSAIFRDRSEFGVLLLSQRATKIRSSRWKYSKNCQLIPLHGLSQGQAWSRHYFTKLARKTTV